MEWKVVQNLQLTTPTLLFLPRVRVHALSFQVSTASLCFLDDKEEDDEENE